MKNMALPNKTLFSKKGCFAIGSIALTAALIYNPTYAATIGHARLAPNAGANLNVLIPINELSHADLSNLKVSPAPLSDWQASGLQTPVDLQSINVQLEDAAKPNSKIVRISSTQNINDSIIDLLLDIKTASGSERYQVSLVIPPIKSETVSASASSSSKTEVGIISAAGAKTITVNKGDTMFAIARRNAVSGVSVYQLMMALQRTNPKAFIQNNVNLVRAGANLAVPSVNEMLSISDAEARRQFQAHVDAFKAMQAGTASSASVVENKIETDTSSGQISANTASEPNIATNQGDKLELDSSGSADTVVSQKHAIKDAQIRVTQLEHNVKNLNQALRSQGKAASDIVSDGAQAISDSINQIADSILGADEIDASANGLSASTSANGSESTNAAANNNSTPGATIDATGANQANPATANGAATANQATGSASIGANDAANINNSSQATSNGAANKQSSSAGINIDSPNISIVSSDDSSSASSDKTTAKAQKSDDGSWLSWISNHLLGFITGALALIVLIVAWILHRVNANKDDETDPLVAEAMLEKKLNEIDLNLDQDK